MLASDSSFSKISSEMLFQPFIHGCHIEQANAKEQKKLADKERKVMEKATREKEAALRDDNDVFDVAYENQTDNAADSAVSARDIKV